MIRPLRPLVALLLGFLGAYGLEAPLPALSVVKVLADQGEGSMRQGSGVVVGPGLVATNAHVTAGALSVSVSLGSQIWRVRSRKDDLHRDLSVLEVPDLPLLAVPMAVSAPALGQSVVAIGFPSGQGPKVSVGRITGLWSYLGAEVLQSDATTAPGSSGGGLFDENGRLLGLTTFIFPQSATVHFSVPAIWIQDLEDDPNAKAAPTSVATDLQMPGFLQTLASNPANQPTWDAFAKIWVQSAPNDPDAWFAYANSLEPAREPERIQERIAAYERSLALRNGSPKVWNNLGASLELLNRFQNSEAAFRRALALNPRYAMAWLNLGSLLLEMRRPEEAASALARGLELEPDNAVSWARLGDAHMDLNHFPEAGRYYHTALGLSPFRAGWWADLARACAKARDETGLRQALARLATLDPSQAKALEKAFKNRSAQ